MRLSEVTIKNFCSCDELTIPVAAFNPIVGYNNSGKSNILRAINWLLKKAVQPAHMFHNANEAIWVSGVIEDVTLELLPPNQQRAVTPFLHEGALKIRRIQPNPGCPAAQVKVEVFDYTNNVWSDNPAGLDNALAVLFPEPIYIEAMDNTNDDIGRFAAKNTIGLLLKQVLERIHAQNAPAVLAMQDAFSQVSAFLTGQNRLAELNTFETEASSAIASFFPGMSLHLNFTTPGIEEIFKTSTVTLSDVQGSPRPISSFGHGAQRSAHMALIKLLADMTNAAGGNAGGTIVLLIDEPELCLHPQAVELLRESLLLLSTQNFQVVFSTHSPLLIGSTHALQTLMIYKDGNNRTAARQKLQSAATALQAHPAQAEVVFSLQTATHLLFSEKVLLVEGKTEIMLIPEIYQAIRGHSYAHDKGCLVSGSSSSSLVPMMTILRAVGYMPKALADLDFAFKVAPQSGLIDERNPDILACKAWFAANAAQLNILLANDGLPTKQSPQGVFSALKPAEAFERMAQAMAPEVRQIVNELRERDIWIWSNGAIEAHLGIGKSDAARIGFATTARQNGNLEHASAPQTLVELVNWL
ncbi:ATP-dependent nuclease [Bordetella bronchiseptica]|uniref:ATP-dependent nuclease n=1 Tax=Bordetella bronchiseptica TaxID=518 RepID=UPI003EDBABC0